MLIWNYDLLASSWCISRRVHDVIVISDASKGTNVVKHFSCVISSEVKIFACCKKHMSYFSNIYLHLIETKLYRSTISLASKLLKCDECFVIFDISMNVKIDFHISHSQKRPVKYIKSFETPLLILYKTSCPISSVHEPIFAFYK